MDNKENTKQHLLFITPGFAASESDTPSVTYFLNYLLKLKKAMPESLITVVTIDYPFEKRTYKWHGITVHAFGLYKANKIRKVLSFRQIANQLIKENKTTPITLIHSLWLKQASLLGLYLSRKLNIHCVMTAMGMEFVKPNPYLRFFNKQRSSVVHVSQRQSLDSPYQSPEIIPWGVIKQEDLSSQRSIDLLFVGFLNENKNITLALEIFKTLIKSKPNLRIKVIGDYFNVDEWRTSLSEMNLQNNIEFTGRIKNDEVIKKMKNSKILIHTSNYESLGYAMLEALSCGTYVVSKEVGIACVSKNWKIVESKTEFINCISDILDNYKYPGPELPIPLQSTVTNYTELYSKLS